MLCSGQPVRQAILAGIEVVVMWLQLLHMCSLCNHINVYIPSILYSTPLSSYIYSSTSSSFPLPFFSSQARFIGSAEVNVDPEPTPATCPSRTCMDPTPCLNGGSCMNVTTPDATYTCMCINNFFGSGCQNYDACASEPCLNGGNCTINLLTPGQFICSCPERTEGGTCILH